MKKSIILYFIIGAEAILIAILLYQYNSLKEKSTSTEVIISDPGLKVLSTECNADADVTVMISSDPVPSAVVTEVSE